MTRRLGGRYRETEVRALVENYGEALEDRDTTERGMRKLIAVADLKLAWRKMNLTEREVLLVCGVLGVSSRDAEAVLEKSKSWVSKHYNAALSRLTYEMNGGPNG